MDELRSYSSVFSRGVFSDIMEYNDYAKLDILLAKYDRSSKRFHTYLDYVRHVYRAIAKKYRCEYVYKNEIINKLLIKNCGLKDSVVINEFRVKDVIVDLALFNGESKAFEIKTEYDTPKRLAHQMEVYTKLFQRCYVVVPSEHFHEYERSVRRDVGIFVMKMENGKIRLEKEREALLNCSIDANVLMRTVRTSEYKNIVKSYFGHLPNVSCFDMFEACRRLIATIPQQELCRLFLAEMKKRVNNTQLLKSFPPEIRQVCLSMNLNGKQSDCLLERLNNAITL